MFVFMWALPHLSTPYSLNLLSCVFHRGVCFDYINLFIFRMVLNYHSTSHIELTRHTWYKTRVAQQTKAWHDTLPQLFTLQTCYMCTVLMNRSKNAFVRFNGNVHKEIKKIQQTMPHLWNLERWGFLLYYDMHYLLLLSYFILL